ncbi:MAG: cupin domain-containing protein [Bdellovibrionales bacterium]|nr:cupin domain-containing protein [Bdellovibrionales bacterium]
MNPQVPTVVHRHELQMTSGLEVDGVWRNAGAVYTMRGHPVLDRLIPPDWSVSWTTLPDHRPLDPHLHPIESHVAIVNGRAHLTGQQQLLVDAGTVVQVPPWHLHGFSRVEDKTFWAITWQRSPQSLFYEDGLVYFETSDAAKGRINSDTKKQHVALQRCQILPADDAIKFRAKAITPEFFTIDLATKASVKIQTLGPTLIFATVSDSEVSMGSKRYTLTEGDTFALDSGNPRNELHLRRRSPDAHIGILVFPLSGQPA